MSKTKIYIRNVKEHFRRTWKNKLFGIGMIILGFLTTLLDSDATAFVFILLFAIPLLISKENYIK